MARPCTQCPAFSQPAFAGQPPGWCNTHRLPPNFYEGGFGPMVILWIFEWGHVEYRKSTVRQWQRNKNICFGTLTTTRGSFWGVGQGTPTLLPYMLSYFDFQVTGTKSLTPKMVAATFLFMLRSATHSQQSSRTGLADPANQYASFAV